MKWGAVQWGGERQEKGAKKVEDGKIPGGAFLSEKALRSGLHGGICL